VTPFPKCLAPLFASLALIPVCQAEDESIRAAPQWDCSTLTSGTVGIRPPREQPMLLWASKVPGFFAGALAGDHHRLLVGSTDFKTCTMNLFDSSGRLHWSARHPSLDSRQHDYGAPLRCRPTFDGDRAYYMSNRGEIVCVDVRTSLETAATAPDARPDDAPILWKLDLMKELGVFKRDASDVGNPLPSPLVVGDLLFCVTAHGIPSPHERADPKPPSFLALNKFTGKVAWSSSAPGANIVFSQWASPVSASVKGAEQVIFPGGDGILYAFEPATGRPLWEFDCNPLGARDRFHEPVGWTHLAEARCGFFSTPTVHGTRLYVALNENYETLEPHPLLAIELAAPDDQPKIAWQFGDPAFKGTNVSAAVGGGLVFLTGDDSLLFAIDEKTGRECWRADLESGERALCPAPVIYRDRVYAGGEMAVSVFAVSPQKKCLGHYDFGEPYVSTPAFEDDMMFVAASEHVFAVRLPP
jgi:outer membrane protein assembly factor BamB